MGDSFDEEFGDAGGRGAILAAKRPGFASYWPSSERATRCSFMRWTLVHAVCGTAGHVADVTEGNAMLHGQESVVYADAGYQGAEKRLDARPGVRWSVAMRPGKRKKLDRLKNPIDTLVDKIEKLKASHRGQGRSPISRHQASVWLSEGSRSGIKKYAATQNRCLRC